MDIRNPVMESHFVTDWEFNFQNGSTLIITVDSLQGDTCEFSETATMVKFFLAEKPSSVDPDGTLEAEDVWVPTKDTVIRRRNRLVEETTLEEKEEWNRVLRDLSDTKLRH